MYLKSIIYDQACAGNYEAKIAGVSPDPGVSQLAVAGLFAGIGGLERGFLDRGHHSVLLCEADARAGSARPAVPQSPIVGGCS
jgi:hypothetical protein